METRLIGTLVTPYRLIAQGEVSYENGTIVYVGPYRKNHRSKTVDMSGAYIAPGFIDIHVHGGGGRDFAEGNVDAILTAAKYHAKNGTAVLLPTASTSPDEVYFDFFAAYEKALPENTEGASMPGIHMEGPNFALSQVGAQDPRYVIPPKKEWYEKIYAACDKILRWDVAAERDENMEFGRWLTDRGILASIGHSDATLEEAIVAYENGYTHLTHFYSGMSALTRKNSYRFPGLIEAGYMHNDFTVEIIADGSHLPPSLLRHIYKTKGSDKIALVTDALAEAGLPEGTVFPPDESPDRQHIIEDGVCKMLSRQCFAGSIATSLRLVSNMAKFADCGITDAVKMITATPAKIMGFKKKGILIPGNDADITVFTPDFAPLATVVGGRTVFEA